jgi:hypothetical protein
LHACIFAISTANTGLERHEHTQTKIVMTV